MADIHLTALNGTEPRTPDMSTPQTPQQTVDVPGAACVRIAKTSVLCQSVASLKQELCKQRDNLSANPQQDRISVVQSMDIIAVRLISTVFSCRIAVCTVCKSHAYFVLLSPRLSVPHATCLHFHFSVSRPAMRGIWSPIQ